MMKLLKNAGSSPHERGTAGSSARPLHPGRFIPARAGNSASFIFLLQIIAVHPRTSGEQLPVRRSSMWITGSSPHERGTVPNCWGREQRQRFIPARAGNSFLLRLYFGRLSVHPRTSGEQSSTSKNASMPSGSSPHERGTVAHDGQHHALLRFIPARAGNSVL